MGVILNGEMSIDSDGIVDGNITYLWSTIDGAISGVTGTTLSSTASTITTTSIGTYTLTVTDGTYGNTDTESHLISTFITPPTIVITPDNPEISETEDVLLTATGADTYLWSPGGETGDTITVTGGTYSVIGTDNDTGCTGSTISIVSINNLSVMILSGDTILNCSTQSIDLTTTVTGDTNNLQYEWEKVGYGPLGFTDTLTINSSGEYKITVTEDITNLVAEDTIIISGTLLDDQPISVITGLNTLGCTATTVVLDGTSSIGDNLEYEWSVISGSATGSTTGSTLDVVALGEYQLTVTSSLNSGCNDTTTHTVSGQTTPFASIDQQTTNIPDPTITITSTVTGGTPSYTYEWLSNTGSIVGSNTNSSVEINASGGLTLNVTDLIGCTSTASRKVSVNAGDTEAPTVPTNVIATQISADTESITITWNASIDNVGVTNYTLTRYTNGSITGDTIDNGGTTPSYQDNAVLFGDEYCYTVKAVDAAGNESANSLLTTASCELLPIPSEDACEEYLVTHSNPANGGTVFYTNCSGDFDSLIVAPGVPGSTAVFCALQIISVTGSIFTSGPLGLCNP